MRAMFNLPLQRLAEGFDPGFLKLPASLIASIGIAAALLWIPPHADVTRRIYGSGLEIILFILVIFSVLLGRRGLFWGWISLLFTLLLFTLSLIYKWQGSGENYFLIGGLLPWSDSYGYYDEAQRLLHGLNLTPWGARRPFFPAFLSVLLMVANNNFQLVLIVLVLLNALAVYLAAREIQVSLKSPIGAAIYLVVSFLFYRRFAGTVMTENLGFLLGNLALVFLLRGVREENVKKLCWGLFVLTIGLNARAGAFFVLPMLAIWMTYFLRNKFIWWRVFVATIGVIFLGMASNLILLKLIGPVEDAVPFSNFSYTFYGLASGNEGWDQVVEDYPDLKEEEVPALAIEKFKENPYMLVIGITRAYRSYMTASQGSFSFLWIQSPQKEFASSILWLLTAIGLVYAVVEMKRHPYLGFALACFLGILFSVSLLPPIDADKMRVYAATIPLTTYIISLGVSVPGLIYKKYSGSQGIESGNENSFLIQPVALPLSIVLLFALFFGTLLVKQLGHVPGKMSEGLCSSSQEKVRFLMGPGSSVSIKSDADIQESYLPQIRLSDFQSASRIHESELEHALLSLEDGSTLNLGVQTETSNGREDVRSAFFVSSHVLKPGEYDLCVIESKSELLRTYPFYYQPDTLMTKGQEGSRLSDDVFLKARFWYSFVLWMLFGLFVLDIVQIWKFPAKIIPFVFVNSLMISIGLLVFVHCQGLVPLQWQSVPLNVEDAKRSRNFMYRLDLNTPWMSAKDLWNYPVKLYENDVELNNPDKIISLIAKEGEGRFQVTEGNLYFSSSDNSIPRENGRNYKIVWPTPVRIRYQWISYLLAVVCIFIHIKYFRRIALSRAV